MDTAAFKAFRTFALLSMCFASTPLAAEPSQGSVLLLDQGYVGSPWYGTFSNTFRSTLGNHVPGVEIHAEPLDFGHFSGAGHEEISRVYLRDKYGASRIRMIVAAGPKAL